MYLDYIANAPLCAWAPKAAAVWKGRSRPHAIVETNGGAAKQGNESMCKADQAEIRPGERLAPWDGRTDAGVVFIGRIRTPWTSLAECPRHGRPDGPLCRIEVFETWAPALDGVEKLRTLEVFYWLDRSRRDSFCRRPATTA